MVEPDKTNGISAIKIGSGSNHAGMGTIVGVRHILTCAHVVNIAIGRAIDETACPTEGIELSICFPLRSSLTSIRAHVAKWRPPGSEPQDDIAVLETTSIIPDEAGIAILANVTGQSLQDDALSVFGIRGGMNVGNYVDAEFKGDVTSSWTQIDGVNHVGAFIASGYSGAPVWDKVHSAVVGMVVAKNTSESERVAYMIPSSLIHEFWPNLEVEDRNLPRYFSSSWTVFGTIYLLLLATHFLVERGVTGLSYLTASQGVSALAAMWGMHVYALLSPILCYLFAIHTRNFRLHSWEYKVPAFGIWRNATPVRKTKIGAIAVVVLFLVLPLYLQGHFIRQFHNKGNVAIYPQDFGYTVEQLLARGETCAPGTGSLRVCTHPNAGRYSVMNNDFSWELYFDNAYHYGGDNLQHTQTFFPILQPTLIYVLTGVSLFFIGSSLFRIVKLGTAS